MSALRKAFGDMEKKLKLLKPSTGGGADQGAVDALYDELMKLR